MIETEFLPNRANLFTRFLSKPEQNVTSITLLSICRTKKQMP